MNFDEWNIEKIRSFSLSLSNHQKHRNLRCEKGSSSILPIDKLMAGRRKFLMGQL